MNRTQKVKILFCLDFLSTIFNFSLLLVCFRWIVFRRVFLMLSVLYMMRSITMYVTVLPMSSNTYYCSPKANTTSILIIGRRVFQLISGFGLSINGKHTYCGDYIYSGHTVILVICYLIIAECKYLFSLLIFLFIFRLTGNDLTSYFFIVFFFTL